MTIDVECGACGASYRVGNDKAGRNFRCKTCGEAVAVPAAYEGDVPKEHQEPGRAETRRTKPASRQRPLERDPVRRTPRKRTSRRMSSKKKKAPGIPILAWAIGGGGVALLVAATFFVISNFTNAPQSAGELAQVSDPQHEPKEPDPDHSNTKNPTESAEPAVPKTNSPAPARKVDRTPPQPDQTKKAGQAAAPPAQKSQRPPRRKRNRRGRSRFNVPDVPRLKPYKTISAHSFFVRDGQFHPDKKSFWILKNDIRTNVKNDENPNGFYAFDTETWERIQFIPIIRSTLQFELSPDGERMIGEQSQDFFVWEIGSGEFQDAMRRLAEPKRVMSFQLSPDGRHVAIISAFLGVLVLDLETGEVRVLAKSQVGTFGKFMMAFSSDSDKIVVVGRSGDSKKEKQTLLCWNVQTEELLYQLKPPSTPPFGVADPTGFTAIAPSPVADEFATATTASKVLFYKQGESAPYHAIETIGDFGRVSALKYFPDGKRIVVANSNGIWLVDIATGQYLAHLYEFEPSIITESGGWMDFTSDGRYLATPCRRIGWGFCIWDMSSLSN